MNDILKPENKTVTLFKEKEIRHTLHNEERCFSEVDIAEALTNSVNPTDYLKKVRSRDEELSKGWGQIITPFAIDTAGGKQKIKRGK